MNKKFKLIIFLILILSFGAIMPTYADFNEHFNLGQNYLAQYKYSGAISEFQKALKTNPYDNSARIGLINSYLARGTDLANNRHKYKIAAEDFKSAMFYLKYYVNDDIVEKSSSSIDAVEKNLNLCEKRARVKNNSDNHYLMAEKLYKNKNYSAAAYEYEQIIDNQREKKLKILNLKT